MRISLAALGTTTAFICPSNEQLVGIVDMSDPCQNPDVAAQMNDANDIANLPLLGVTSTGAPIPANSSNPILNPSGAVLAGATTPASTSTTTLLYVGMAAVGAMLLLGMMHRR